MVIKAFGLSPFTTILKALPFKGHIVEIIKNMRKYFHKGRAKWGNVVTQTRFIYVIKSILILFSTKHISQKQVLEALRMGFTM